MENIEIQDKNKRELINMINNSKDQYTLAFNCEEDYIDLKGFINSINKERIKEIIINNIFPEKQVYIIKTQSYKPIIIRTSYDKDINKMDSNISKLEKFGYGIIKGEVK